MQLETRYLDQMYAKSLGKTVIDFDKLEREESDDVQPTDSAAIEREQKSIQNEIEKCKE